MDEFSGIFFHMGACDAQALHFAVDFDIEVAVFTDRQVELRGLEILRKIGVIIVFAVEFAEAGDLAVQSKTGADSVFEDFLIQDRQHARQAETDRAYIGIRICAEGCLAAAEDFGGGLKLGMDFKADDYFIFHSLISPFGAVLVNSG